MLNFSSLGIVRALLPAVLAFSSLAVQAQAVALALKLVAELQFG